MARFREVPHWDTDTFHLWINEQCNRTGWAGIAQSVLRLATGWAVRGSNPSGGEIFRTLPDRPWGPLSLLYNGYRVFPEGKAAGATGWAVRGSNPSGGEIFRTLPDRPWDPLSLL